MSVMPDDLARVPDALGLGTALGRVMRAIRVSPFSGVFLSPAVGPVPDRAWVERSYYPEGKRRQRRERIEAEAPTMAAALHALATRLEARRVQ